MDVFDGKKYTVQRKAAGILAIKYSKNGEFPMNQLIPT